MADLECFRIEQQRRGIEIDNLRARIAELEKQLAFSSETSGMRADAERLRQFIEDVYADPWLTPNIWANLDAALDGEWLYQKLPGWDESKPGQKPVEG